MERVTLKIASSDELDNALSKYEDLTVSYGVEVDYDISQEELVMLAQSPIGRNLKELSTNIPECECDPLRWEYAESIDFSEISFPQLLSLQSWYLNLEAIDFTQENTSKLKHLSVSLVENRLQYFKTDLPDLETCKFQHLSLWDRKGLGKSLSKSPKLKSIDCYEFYGLGNRQRKPLVLVLPKCENLSLYRCEGLNYIQIWAPKLQDINFQAVFDIEEVIILDDMPYGYKKIAKKYDLTDTTTSEYTVNFLNIPVMPKGNAATHSRCKEVLENRRQMCPWEF